MKKFFAMLKARNKEFYRDKGTLIWALVFPFLVIGGFSFAFSGTSQDQYKIAILMNSGSSVSNPAPASFLQMNYVKYVQVSELEPALEKVRRHQYDLLVAPAQTPGEAPKYWVNANSPKGYFLEKILPAGSIKQTVEGKETRYVDWVFPGVIAMNMMFSALYGVGYTIVRYRKNGVLKRFKATPVNAFQFLSAQIFSRLFVIQVVSAIVFIGCHTIVDFQMRGSYVDLFIFFGLGGICMISLSTLVAARLASEELAEGILNVLAWPMIFFSGVWFSLEGTNPVLQGAAKALPLTHIVDGTRAIMLDGATLAGVAPQLILLAVLTAVFLSIGSVMFRWN